MKKKLFLITALLLFHCKIFSQLKTCSDGVAKAISDLDRGVCKYYEFGIPSDSRTFEKLLKKKLGVVLDIGGCRMPEDLICYNETIRDSFARRNGYDIIDSIEKEAVCMDSTGRGTRAAFYKEWSGRALREFMYCNINPKLLTELSIAEAPKVKVEVQVSSTGIPLTYELSVKADAVRNSEALRIAKLIPFFDVATQDGIPVADRVGMFFIFSSTGKGAIDCP